MSKGIRDQVHGYVEMIMSDQRLAEIKRTLKLAATKHKVSVSIKVDFEVDEDGRAKMTTAGTLNLKIPAWDNAVDLRRQMTLFEEDDDDIIEEIATTEDPRRPEPVQAPTPAPAPLTAEDIDPDPPEPRMKPIVEGAVMTPAEKRLLALEEENEATLAAGARDGSQLTPEAQAALKERAKRA